MAQDNQLVVEDAYQAMVSDVLTLTARWNTDRMYTGRSAVASGRGAIVNGRAAVLAHRGGLFTVRGPLTE